MSVDVDGALQAPPTGSERRFEGSEAKTGIGGRRAAPPVATEAELALIRRLAEAKRPTPEIVAAIRTELGVERTVDGLRRTAQRNEIPLPAAGRHPPKKGAALTRADLERLIAEGLTPEEMRKRLGLTRSTFRRRAIELGVTLPNTRDVLAARRPPPVKPEHQQRAAARLATLRQLASQRLPADEIAEKMGCRLDWVRKAARRHGVSIVDRRIIVAERHAAMLRRLVVRDMMIKDMAAEMGITPDHLRGLAARFGIALPSRGRRATQRAIVADVREAVAGKAPPRRMNRVDEVAAIEKYLATHGRARKRAPTVDDVRRWLQRRDYIVLRKAPGWVVDGRRVLASDVELIAFANERRLRAGLPPFGSVAKSRRDRPARNAVVCRGGGYAERRRS